MKIQYRPGRLNSSADALSRCPQSLPADPEGATVAAVSTTISSESTADITTLLSADPPSTMPENFADDQKRYSDLLEIFGFIQNEELPPEEKCARRIALQSPLLTVEDDIHYYVDPKQKHQKRVAVSRYLQDQILPDSCWRDGWPLLWKDIRCTGT